MLPDDLLLGVRKPGQYIGEEWNVSRKDFDAAGVKFCLCFPDLYEVGMSNLGLRILYGVLNERSDVVCERCFAPAPDMEALLRKEKAPLYSLESGKPLADFDIIGFSLGYELCYTNILAMLELAGIPLRTAQRDRHHPLVIAGGPAALNPEPVADFFDAVIIGEAEEAVLEALEEYRRQERGFKKGAVSRKELLFALSQVKGVYVPSLYDVTYAADGSIESFVPKEKGVPQKVQKRFIGDLDASFFPVDWLVPNVSIVHDRLSLEVMRGCPNRCRFCQARSQYYPLRTRKPKSVVGLADALYRATGYEELSLLGLSVSDYPGLAEVVRPLIERFRPEGISVSIPSVKPRTILSELAGLIATIKKTGLTFAPEAATARMRSIIGKDFDEAEFFNTLAQAFGAGYQHVKLYFMIGLPFESETDLEDILDFSCRVSELRRGITKRPAQVNVSVNTLIPKPHTAFQWFGMLEQDAMRAKQQSIREKNRNRSIRLSFHDPAMSFLEGVFSRGDRRLSAVIEAAFRKGCRLDAWGEHLRFDFWLEAFSQCGIEPGLYLKEKALEELLPWDFIDTGVSRDFLVEEYQKVKDPAPL
ncbi:MAG: TIGR03960 family B12-binding radical SAM protein [Candidatus Omnitrophica bacterium]|nr:TIGR03960 family B12-binding radical SAM protein [Candidatus Omnitrophota bacterium]